MRNVTLPNRIVVSPMGMHSAVDGIAGDWHLMHLGQFAVSGPGLVITEAVAIEPEGRVSCGCLGIWSDSHIDPYRRVLAFCREYGGAKLGIQLNHSGRKGSVSKSWEGQKPVSPDNGGWHLLGPSSVAYPGRPAPIEADEAMLASIRESFANAARRHFMRRVVTVRAWASRSKWLQPARTPTALLLAARVCAAVSADRSSGVGNVARVAQLSRRAFLFSPGLAIGGSGQTAFVINKQFD
jgi:hypothetical protein